ncbi:MAG: hypothetical protein AAGC91_12165 [Pseudomonadota bacterium]
MRVVRILTLCAVALSSAVALLLPAAVAANGCTFRGEIVYADDYEKIVIERANAAPAGEALGPHAPLFPGDTLLVRGDQVIWIRDEPGGDLREITAGDGRVNIGQPDNCDVRKGFAETLSDLISRLAAILEGPVADQPVVTHPVRGDTASGGLKLAFEQKLLLAEGLDALSVHWVGVDATVELRSTSDDRVRLSASTDGVPIVEEQLDLPLQAGDELILELRSEEGRVLRAVTVVTMDQLPKPAGVKNLNGLTPSEDTIYAIWLATEGPAEWRLQGMTMLAQAAQDDYLAWKVLRGLTARILE